MLMGISLSLIMNFSEQSIHSNVFLMFFLLDIGFNLKFMNEKSSIDRNLYGTKLTGFINVVEKLSALFEILDDLSSFFIPFIIVSSLVKFYKITTG